MRHHHLAIPCLLLAASAGCTGGIDSKVGAGSDSPADYPVVDTGQSSCYSTSAPVACPQAGAPLSGQDAQHQGLQPSYLDQGDGTVLDEVTGLEWAQAIGDKVTFAEAFAGAADLRLGGHDDWRVPTIKELYSLIDFSGGFHSSPEDSTPYLDTDYFDFVYGDESAGERFIDAQYWSSTEYVGTTMGGAATVFGVNFADGRIKGYPQYDPGPGEQIGHRMFVRYVRGNPGYGRNDLSDAGDGMVRDDATGLSWQQADAGEPLSWADALAHCQGLELGGHDDWRLPNAKELQSIVDYGRAPAVTGTAAIDPLFNVSDAESYFWTSTTHLDGPLDSAGSKAVYVAFGRALGFMETPPGSGQVQLLDVHGAGAQRSDPKEGDPADYPQGFGPQGDDIRIFNHVRCVR